jgi:uncharacterized membrane protein
MNTLSYSLLAVVVGCWTLNPFFRKKAQADYSIDGFALWNSIQCTLAIGALGTARGAAFGAYVPSRWMLASLVTTVASTYALVMLLRDNNASWVIPQTQPLVLMLTAVTGRVVFQERLSARQLLGVLLIIAAVVLLQHKPTNKTLPLETLPGERVPSP